MVFSVNVCVCVRVYVCVYVSQQATLIPPFNVTAYPGDPSNTPCVQLISEGPVHTAVEALYGPWTVARLALARAAFLQGLGRMATHWSATDQATGTLGRS